MNKLGSEFFKPIDGFERGLVGGATWRQVLMMLGIFLGAGLSTLIIVLGLPDILMYVMLLVTIPPSAIYGLKKDETLKELLRFKLTQQERSYMTDNEMEDTRGNFTQAKGVHEWNDETL